MFYFVLKLKFKKVVFSKNLKYLNYVLTYEQEGYINSECSEVVKW